MPDGWRGVAGGSEVSVTDLDGIARELLAAAGKSTVWLVSGEMGSGKTTLIKAIGRALGVTETMSSPTFSIINEYGAPGNRMVYHIDLYRLKDEKELFETGLEEYLNSMEYCLIEWPEKLGGLTPQHFFKIRITPSGASRRRIEYMHV